MKKEIEVKAKIIDMEKVISELMQNGCELSDPVVQEDAIFVNFDGDFTAFMPGTNFLRIRKSKGKVLLTLKQPQKNELDCIEHEVEVSDAEEIKSMLELMGYHEAVKVTKTRRKGKFSEYEICVDEVVDLGSFIEIEKLTDEEDGEVVQEELLGILERFGIDRSDRVINGYDTLVYLKRHPK